MLETLRNAFKIKEVRGKLLFTFFMLIVVRAGCQIPVPGVNNSAIADFLSSNSGDAFNFFDAMTGGSFMDMSIFALNIT